MLPKIVKNFSGFVDGRALHGLIDEIALPKLSRKMDEYQGGGMLGSVSIDLGMDKMQLELTLAEYQLDLLALWGVGDAGGVSARFVGAARADDSAATVQAIEIAVRGRFQEIDKGSWKRGDRAKMKLTMPLTYFRYTANTAPVIEIDLIDGIEIVNGVDRTAAVRAALGQA